MSLQKRKTKEKKQIQAQLSKFMLSLKMSSGIRDSGEFSGLKRETCIRYQCSARFITDRCAAYAARKAFYQGGMLDLRRGMNSAKIED